MATTLHMQLPLRPSTDRSASFDQPRPWSTPPFTSQYDPISSQSTRPNSHSRTSSNASNTSPYQQPFTNSYFPQPNQMYSIQPQSWSTPVLPAATFQPSPLQPYPNQPIFQPGFQQSQADFAAWATAYQHMVMASVASSPPQHDYPGDRRRTNSGPQTQYNPSHPEYPPLQHVSSPPSTHHSAPLKQPQAFHPYQRGHSHKPPNDKMPRSTSQPTLPSTLDQLSPSSSMSSTRMPLTTSVHARISSVNSSVSSIIPPPRAGSRVEIRKDSLSSERDRRDDVPAHRVAPSATPPTKSAPTTPTIRAVPTPLHTGPIANATNSIPPVINRSSPLFQASIAHTPEPTEKMVKSGGLRGRLKKALEKDSKRDCRSSTPPSPARTTPTSTSKPVLTSPSETSTRSATPPTTPPLDFPHPSPPFANTSAMGSEVSLAETERTTTAPSSEMAPEKGKRSLFRMRNMSTDNISLASTVSSASMMIRKMGSIGRLARRNR